MPLLVEPSSKSIDAAWIEIRRDRLLANLQAVAHEAGPRCQMLAVIKANAYGHGLIEVARTLAPYVRFLGAASIAEALELKEHGMGTGIFLFGCLLPHEIKAVLGYGITLSVSGFDEAREISMAAETMRRPTNLHLKIDTGMGRLGISLSKARREIERIAQLQGINLEGIYTHFPTAEVIDGFTERQVRDFTLLLRDLDEKGIRFRFVHAANSAGILKIKSPVFNLVRPGLMLYGVYPAAFLRETISLAPILSLKSRILLVKELAPGESAGYGRDFIAQRPTKIAVLPIGYSHGYPFSASNRASVLFRGKRYPIAGRVSMDYMTIDLGETDARAGEEVTLIGQDGRESITAEEVASWAQTIPYEILTRLSPRLTRIYPA